MNLDEAMERAGALKRWSSEVHTKSDAAVILLDAEVRRLEASLRSSELEVSFLDVQCTRLRTDAAHVYRLRDENLRLVATLAERELCALERSRT